MTSCAVIGGGAFGGAMVSLLKANGIEPTVVDIGEVITEEQELVVIAVPVSHFREALLANEAAFGSNTVAISCSKGIEKGTCFLPYEIYSEVIEHGHYHALSGPSFANEITDKVPTVVDVASPDNKHVQEIQKVLETEYFKIEEHDSIPEIELAGAMKNVYAIAAGFIRGIGGGANTHAHLQVVALREYRLIASALFKTPDILTPSIVGDLHLTTSSEGSRNFRYGLMRARNEDSAEETVEGKNAIMPLLTLADKAEISLPLAKAVHEVIVGGTEAKMVLYDALGF